MRNAVLQIPQVVDNRALLASIGDRTVRRVVGENSPYGAALLAVAWERKERWLDAEWAAAVDELETCTLTIAQFLEIEHARS
jgi:hypothetical protein